MKNDTQSSLIVDYISKTKQELAHAPTGVIRLATSRGYPQFYLSDTTSEKGRYLSANDMPLITKMCQRDYNKKILIKLNELQKKEERGERFNLENELDNVYLSFRIGKRALITPIIPTLDDFIINWYKKYTNSMNPIPISAPIITERGETVRSKSEKIIADKLYKLGIPYVYEAAYKLSNTTKYPDFLVLNKNTRKTYLWEHFGMADREDYSESNLAKLADYEKNGLLIGEDVICSFETNDTPISNSALEKKILTYLQ